MNKKLGLVVALLCMPLSGLAMFQGGGGGSGGFEPEASSDEEKELEQRRRQNQVPQTWKQPQDSDEETEKPASRVVEFRTNPEPFSYTGGGLQNHPSPPSYQQYQQSQNSEEETPWNVSYVQGNQFDQEAGSDEERCINDACEKFQQRGPSGPGPEGYTSEQVINMPYVDPRPPFDYHGENQLKPRTLYTCCPGRCLVVVMAIAGVYGLYEWVKEQRTKKRRKPAGAKC